MVELAAAIEASRVAVLREVEGAGQITLVCPIGNIGDELILAGTRRLLAGLNYREVGAHDAGRLSGPLAVVNGGGGWCRAWHHAPALLQQLESGFDRVVVLPSSFDLSEPSVAQALSSTRAKLFAREEPSYQAVRRVRDDVTLAVDCAFFFDFSSYATRGRGVLYAYRDDPEAAERALPADNRDISLLCGSLDQWLWCIANHEVIYTDRAHVMIAGALLGKQVIASPSNYHKVEGLARWLAEFPNLRFASEPPRLAPPTDRGVVADRPPAEANVDRTLDETIEDLRTLLPRRTFEPVAGLLRRERDRAEAAEEWARRSDNLREGVLAENRALHARARRKTTPWRLPFTRRPGP